MDLGQCRHLLLMLLTTLTVMVLKARQMIIITKSYPVRSRRSLKTRRFPCILRLITGTVFDFDVDSRARQLDIVHISGLDSFPSGVYFWHHYVASMAIEMKTNPRLDADGEFA